MELLTIYASNSGGVGVVVRNSYGIVVGGVCSKVENVTSPELVEFLAGRPACFLAVQSRSVLVNLVKISEPNISIFGRVL